MRKTSLLLFVLVVLGIGLLLMVVQNRAASRGEEPTLAVPAATAVAPAFPTLIPGTTVDYLLLSLENVNCARANAGLSEVKVDKDLTAEAERRLAALRSPQRGDEYEHLVQESPQVHSLYRVVFAVRGDPCSLPWFTAGPEEIPPLADPGVRKSAWPVLPTATACGSC